MNKKKKIVIIFALVIFIFVSVFFLSKIFQSEHKNLEISRVITKTLPFCGVYDTKNVLIGGKNIKMDVSDDDCKRELGFSGRKSLSDGGGMMFIFDKEGSYGFWMKDMNFPIDILWVDDGYNITGIEKNIKPETYPEAFGEKYLAKYVLELKAGFSDENNIKVGNKISISQK